MELFRIKRDIPFMSYGRLTTAISLVTFILAVVFLVIRGLNFSVEFTGGTVMEVQYQQSANLSDIRNRVDALKMGEATVQSLGTSRDVMIRLPSRQGVSSAQLSEKVMSQLNDFRVSGREALVVRLVSGHGKLLRLSLHAFIISQPT